MILKTADLLYLFDFDGTLTGSDNWEGFLKNSQLCFQKLHFNPHKYDIRWCILTSRPKIDKLLIKSVCFYHNLKPQQIITSPSRNWNFKNIQEEASFKENIIKSILDGNFKITYTNRKIQKIYYIDNNIELIKQINNNRKNYKYYAFSVIDFLKNDFRQLLTGEE